MNPITQVKLLETFDDFMGQVGLVKDGEHEVRGTPRTKSVPTGNPTVIDFYADWCGPCKMISPLFELLSTAPDQNIEFAKVDVDNNVEASRIAEIRAMPTFQVWKDGEKKEEIVGADVNGLKKILIKWGYNEAKFNELIGM